MKIAAKNIQLRNVAQNIEVATDDGRYLGRLEGVKFRNDGQVRIRVSGENITIDGDHIVDLRRSLALNQALKLNDNMDDVLDELFEEVAA